MRKFLVITATSLLMTLLMLSCNESNIGSELEDVNPENNEGLFIDNSVNGLDNISSELTLDNDMELLIDEPPMDFLSPKRPPNKGDFIPLGKIFRKMDLTPAQMDSVKKYSKMHHLCKWSLKRRLYEAIKPYMDSVNRERRVIIQKVQNGELTKEEARALINELNQNARLYMYNAKMRILEAMKNCDIIFHRRIASILDDDQLVIWQRFIDSLSQRKR